ncbi:MAG: DUF6982 domain-containing protein [Candidatus Acidiferrales bacterium]
MVKNRPVTTHKKAVISLFEGKPEQVYVNSQMLGREESVEFLTRDGEHKTAELRDVKAVYFVKEFTDSFEPDRKTFLSRPKLEGLWVRFRFRDGDEMEGLVSNDLLELLDKGIRLTPPDLHGNTLWVFIPQTALAEMKVLGVVGIARRTPRDKAAAAKAGETQPKLFGE